MQSKTPFDAILVFGRGAKEDGSISDNVKKTVERAFELYNQGKAAHIIFSGKYSYQIDYIPRRTEAEALASYARELGLPDEAIVKEEESNTTVSNCYYVKKLCLEPNNWENILFVCMQHVAKRAMYNLEKVLGPEYHIELEGVNVVLSQESNELQKLEDKKMQDVIKFYQPFKAGDHEAIYAAAQKELKEKYMVKVDHSSYEVLEAKLAEAAKKVEVGGKYGHYEHPEEPYTVLHLGLLEATEEVCVMYQDATKRAIWVRTLTNFLEDVEWNGEKVPRFTKL